ncbi:CBS domain-containing protein [Phytoactinopolyspora mesophila]|uniref:Uncharacterized protein n=1 Tax=Phytoactinopolyspora mesophila TaxID=2650750 RepID=A0A7K3M6U5_9ACTN|nr:CBS domain-containing protein [Phytoactinopolyspora mesophila]NDL58622.1 hypothetical protein [Phytoactinopolyspora mesophila]
MNTVIKRDGKIVATLSEGDSLLSWFVRNTSQSMDYELRYGGYSVEEVSEGEYPRRNADGVTVWACCESSIGSKCEHQSE